MGVGAVETHAPGSAAEVAELLRDAAGGGMSVRVRGGGTKRRWGGAVQADGEVSTERLDTLIEHNPGDLTAVLEPGARLADAQERFAAEGQRLALDPPLGDGDAATIGGVMATADSGPLRHRFGAPRDLVIGTTVALPDGSLARAGGKVIKNVAGYDLPKLHAGAYGTLGVIVEVVVRLHPLPAGTATAAGGTTEAAALARAAARLAVAPLESECLDVTWRGGTGALLARLGGAAAAEQADAACGPMREAGLEAQVVEDDDAVWERQRAGQRSASGTVVRVAALPSQLGDLLAVAEREGAGLVSRAGAGTAWLRLEGTGDVAAATERIRTALAPAPCVVTDAPDAVRDAVDIWGPADPALLALSRRLKERFDPDRVCNPGVFWGGI